MHVLGGRSANVPISPSHPFVGVQELPGNRSWNRLIDKLSQQRRKEIVLEVRETNLSAQLFFSKQGFRAVNVLRSHYDDTAEDAYYMRYKLDADEMAPFIPRNRISEYDAA